MRWFFIGGATKIHFVFLAGWLGFAAVRDLLARISERMGYVPLLERYGKEALEKGDHK
jgi:hypothetical protein